MSKIKLTNGVKLDRTSIAGPICIDTSNVIASASVNKQALSYTATADCFVVVKNTDNNYLCSTKVNNVELFSNNRMTWLNIIIPLAKGDVLDISQGYNEPTCYKVFGSK